MNFFTSRRLNAQMIFACLFLCSALISLIISHRFFTWHLDDYISQRNKQGQMEIHLQSQLFERELNYITSDIYFLCHSLEMQAFAQDPSDQNYAMLNAELTSFINERGIYDQVRLLDLDGKEITRINQLNQRPIVIPQDELQDKSHRGYFQHCTQLHRGEIYISSVDLNQEYHQIEKPYKPVVRLGMPVYDESGNRKGYIILNYLVKDLLKLVTQPSVNDIELEFMLVSTDGYYSSHRDHAKLWGWLLPNRTKQNFAHDYPQLWAELNKRKKGRFENGQLAMVYDTIDFRVREEMVTPRSLDKDRLPVDDNSYRSTEFRIISMIPEAQIMDKRSRLFYKVGMIWSLHLVISILPIWGLTYLIMMYYNRHLELTHRAHYDKVTDLPNRDLFLETLNNTRDKAHQTQSRFAVLYIDLDGFKPVNDKLGHSSGDDVLVLVGKRLLKCVRQSDMVARIGGDEFAVILSRIGQAEDAQRVADKIKQLIKTPYMLADKVAHVSCSIGCAVYPDQSDNLDELIDLADQRMYDDKRSHKSLKLTRDNADDHHKPDNGHDANGTVSHSPSSA